MISCGEWTYGIAKQQVNKTLGVADMAAVLQTKFAFQDNVSDELHPQIIILDQFFAVHSALAVVYAERKIKKHPYNRDENNKKKICERLVSTGSVINDLQADEYQDNNIDDVQNYYPVHMTKRELVVKS